MALTTPTTIITEMSNHVYFEGTFHNLAEHYSATPRGDLQSDGDGAHKGLTPGLVTCADGQRELHPMQFGIATPDSSTSVHDTFDHSLVNVEEPTKWPWLAAIETSRCILPITSFYCDSYWGDPEGTEIYFQRADRQLLHIAGVYRVWKSAVDDQQLYTMSFFMRPASDYVMDHGSDRQPLFLEPSGIDAWIRPQQLKCAEAIKVLRQYSAEPDLTHHHLRDLPEGWKNRQKGHVRKRGQTMAAQDRCQHTCGF